MTAREEINRLVKSASQTFWGRPAGMPLSGDNEGPMTPEPRKTFGGLIRKWFAKATGYDRERMASEAKSISDWAWGRR